MSKKLNQIEESLPVYLNDLQEDQSLNAENLLSIKDACGLLNISETKIMEWVKKDLIAFERVGEITYFDKNELKILFRKMMIQGLD
ncbi:helix-turn-helix domain-containing protein [Flavobacteriaceae bacterium]|nr:helix-turn-helix domain-containing protein [Flavobacteriaceae bacterium]